MTDTITEQPAARPEPEPQRARLAAALAAFQAELPHIPKDVDSHYGKYADLERVHGKAMPLLGKHGLSFMARPTVLPDGRFVLAYSLMHASGEREDGIYPLPAAQNPQQLGSAITYARRYAFCAVTGVAPGGEDDDGEQASQPANGAERKPKAKREETQRPAQREAAPPRQGTVRGPSPRPPARPENVAPPERGARQRPAAASQPAGSEHARAIIMHFNRLGITDREERLSYTAMLAGVPADLPSTNDLDPPTQLRVADKLSRCRDIGQVQALIRNGDAPEGGQ